MMRDLYIRGMVAFLSKWKRCVCACYVKKVGYLKILLELDDHYFSALSDVLGVTIMSFTIR